MKLNAQQLADFDRDGFLVINNVLDTSTRQRLIDEYAQLIDEVATARGVISEHWSSMDFESRFAHLVATDPQAYEYLDISLPLKNDLSDGSGMHAGDAVFELLTHPVILDIAESVLGPELVSNPVQHTRFKPPERALNADAQGNSNMGRTGWHQDAAVVLENAEASPILTVWVAMTDATPQMGCMRAIPGSHRWEGLAAHCPGRSGKGEIFISPTLADAHDSVDLAVQAGGVVLLHKKTWHGAGPNVSDNIRWSFDLRYQPPGYPTGRECFPEFLARSRRQPDAVISDALTWQNSWRVAKADIARGKTQAVFNERWESNASDPLCA